MSVPQTPTIPLDYTVVPFEILEERWNEYSFSDGTIIRFRVILIRIAKAKGTPVGQYDITSNNLTSVVAPPSERGQPSSSPLTAEEIQNADKFEVKAITTEEHWNVYRLIPTDDIIKVKYIATMFYRLKDKYDQFGEPMYLVAGGPIIAPQPKMGKQSKATP